MRKKALMAAAGFDNRGSDVFMNRNTDDLIQNKDRRIIAFETLFRLAAENAGEGFLGDISETTTDIFRRSLIGGAYPHFWLEVPLRGETGFDLHIYYDRGQVQKGERFGAGCGFGMQGLFDWFFAGDAGGVGIGFAHDLQGSALTTGVYVNFNHQNLKDLQGFFTSMGRPEAYEWTQALMQRIPDDWRPWYIGSFPCRAGAPVRVGSFIGMKRQRLYAGNPRMIAEDLARTGFAAVSDEMLKRISLLAALPFPLDFQLDVNEAGVMDTLGVSIALEMKSAAGVRKEFSEGADAARSLKLMEEWNITDVRWHQIPKASMSQIMPYADDKGGSGAMILAALPEAVKAKWKASMLQPPAKVYYICHARPV